MERYRFTPFGPIDPVAAAAIAKKPGSASRNWHWAPDTNHHVSEQSRQGRRHDLGGVGVFEAATEREVLAGPLANRRQSGTEGA